MWAGHSATLVSYFTHSHLSVLAVNDIAYRGLECSSSARTIERAHFHVPGKLIFQIPWQHLCHFVLSLMKISVTLI